MQIFTTLLLLFTASLASGADLWPFGDGGGNATKIRGVRVKTSLGCTNGQVLKYIAANTQFECQNDAGGVGSGDVGGGPSLTTAGAGLYVLSNSTIGQDTSWTRVAAGQYTLYNATGPNTLIVRAGSAQSSTNLLRVRNSADTSDLFTVSTSGISVPISGVGTFSVDSNGASFSSNGSFSAASSWQVGSTGQNMKAAATILWNSSSTWFGAVADLGLARSPSIANTLLVTNGSSTNYWGLGAGGIQCGSGDGNSAACDVGTSGARVRNVNAAGTGTFGGVVSAAAGTSSGNVATIDGSQTLTNKSIAATQLTGTVATARLGSGTADNTTFLRGDQTWATVSGAATASSSLTDSAVTRTSGTVVTVAAGRWGIGDASPVAHPGNTFTITTLSITNATNASPIVLTVSSTTGTSLRNGDTVMVSGVTGNTAANGTWVVEVQSATTIALNGSAGNGTCSGSCGTVAGSGSGTAVIYGSPQGYTVIDAPASAGLILTCSSTCVMNQSTTPAVGRRGVPLGEVTITSGAFAGTPNDTRRFLNVGTTIQDGTGICSSTAAGETTVSVCADVMRTGATNTITGTVNATAATRTAPHRTGTGSPSGRDNCTVGDTYFQSDATAGQNQWGCTATNTWTLQGGSSGKGYTLHFASINTTSPADAATYYVGRQYGGTTGMLGTTDTTYINAGYILVPVSGTLTVASILANYATGGAGSNETVTYSVCINSTSTCTTLGTTTWDSADGRYSNITGLSIAVSAGDRLILRIVCPTWATNPTGVRIAGDFYVQ